MNDEEEQGMDGWMDGWLEGWTGRGVGMLVSFLPQHFPAHTAFTQLQTEQGDALSHTYSETQTSIKVLCYC